ncbi:sensor histidine kinase [Polaribacter ponticola]|uniref:histidine kinase n=1 Tax=Polaribacter ponticola TaxID=2978475 RepID=A0ABT5SD92_9FLAO|nr:ATP-binding protein [Polaribacter sp. MSW5]MDD7916038.1 ATP-binding protein [Polaribacter sp. MSW5]
MSDFSIRRKQMIYTLSVITGVISLLSCFIDTYLNIPQIIYIHSTTTVIYFLAAFIAKKGNLRFSRFLYFLSLNVNIVTTSSFIGQEGGAEFMFMFALSLPFLVFSFKRDKIYIFIFSLIPMLLWAALYFTDFNLITNYKVDVSKSSNLIYPLSIIMTLSLVMFQLLYYSKLNFRNFSSIHSNREDAIEASNAKSNFLSTMSHEIRTPLNAVIGLSHILKNNGPRNDQVENIEALNYSGKILLNLLNNVLDYSKMQSTKIELDNIPTDLTVAINQIKKIHEPSCNKKGIKMNLEVDENLPIVLLDIVRFNQVLNNLITNAIKFTERGSVTLKITKKKQTDTIVTLLTEVIDTGIGIPKHKQENIWEAFTQASTNTNRLYGGTGLGLPIVKSILESMESKVTIDSKENKGSRFYFEINLQVSLDQELNKKKKIKALLVKMFY